jgi:hypothetical protein
MKLGVIVPFRDREEHLEKFIKQVPSYLTNNNIEYELIVVEQSDKKPFNRGKLLNIGFIEARKLNCDYVVFHDVDMIPVDVDYSYSDIPLHLATEFELENDKLKNLSFDDYFGGVTMFPKTAFEKINGYSNLYWGWGFEDDDLLFRSKKENLLLDTAMIGKNDIKNVYGLYFDGTQSYIKIEKKDLLDFSKNRTILISFKPDDLVSNPNAEYDDFTVFSIPGYDTNISYNSFRRYKVDVWDDKNKCISMNSEILTNHFTQIALVINAEEKTISFYKDGELVGRDFYKGKLKDYSKEQYFYLGVADPKRSDANYFSGIISEFAIYNDILTRNELETLSEYALENSLMENFKGYNSSHKLMLYYDSKFVRNNYIMDLTFNKNDGQVFVSHFTKSTESLGKIIDVPYRRVGLFKLLSHKTNSWDKGNWVHSETRINQIKFLNEIKQDLYDTTKDGLNSCMYQIIGDTHMQNYHRLSVLI